MASANRWRVIVLIFGGVFFSNTGRAAKLIKYPNAESVIGTVVEVIEKVSVSNRQAESVVSEKVVRPGMVFKDKAHFKAKEGSLRIRMSKTHSIILFQDSEIEFPGIHWESGRVDFINLKKGSFRSICENSCGGTVNSDLISVKIGEGDIIYHFKESVPEFGVKVLKGESDFRGYEVGDLILVKEGFQTVFVGKFEDGAISYDILLSGEKVAKGKTSPIEKVDNKLLSRLLEEEQKLKAAEVVRQKKTSRKRNQICSQPFGELNQCLWKCENLGKSKNCQPTRGSLCVRHRCNANGEWIDRTELSDFPTFCESQATVKKCDY